MNLDELRGRARATVESPSLTFGQRRHHLAALAEEALPYPPVSAAAAEALDKRVICDLYEGHAPYRPRYLLPDYGLAIAQGSAFLELEPPTDLDEALNFLQILYAHVPSITGYPVYLGDLDKVLLPFVNDVDDASLYKRLRLFWIALDRMLPDGFVHTNIGPDDSRLARVILRLERELLQIVPNLTLKVDPERTPDGLMLDAVETVFACAKPHFVNHPLMTRDLGERYAVVSCYNSLKVGGGSHTLVRLNLREVALRNQGGAAKFLETTLPRYVELTAEIIEARIRYLVEEARFFDHHFLAMEGLLDLGRFSAMYGVFGMAEAVEILLEQDGRGGSYGHDPQANDLALRITKRLAAIVGDRAMPHCGGGSDRCLLHSQSGIDVDVDVTAGSRVRIGEETDMYTHITAVAPHHDHFAAGTVLASIERLAASGQLAEVRMLIVPDRNDDPRMLRETARWLASVDPTVAVRVIGFRQLGVRAAYTDLPEPEQGHLDSIA